MNTLVLRRRYPFADFDVLFRTAFAPVPRTTGFNPAAEVSRDGDDAVIRVELPGVDAERDVTVDVDHGHLVIRGERRDEHAKNTGGRTLREVHYGAFRRSFVLPGHATADDVTASYDAGVLSMRVAGAYAGTSPRRIPVNGIEADESAGAVSTDAERADTATSTEDEQAA
ncbi:MAG TPA: Hsp20/alpha crystallin family protein [Jiangellaceae bacterium]|nr:Hsp20/alpha crystallin family protein [Jiangellaceae bacterium]